MQCFEEAAKILLDLVGGGGFAKRPKRLEGFDYCLGLMEMNSDQRVGKKMAEKGDVLIPQTERSRLVQRATAGHGWLGLGWPLAIDELRKMFPKLKLTQFELNGADDVVKYDKFWSQESSRMVVMGRPGSTEAVREGMAAARPKPIDTDDANFVLGPELPDISSSAARAATVAGDREALKGLAHPAVAEWLISQPWAGAAAAGDGGTAPEPEPEPAAEEGVPPSCSLTEKLIASASVTDDDIKACTAEVESLKQQLLITQPIAKNKTIGKGPPPPPGGGRGGPPPPPPPPPPPDPTPAEKPGLSPQEMMRLEIEATPLKKKLKAGTITPEENTRLDEIATLLAPPPPEPKAKAPADHGAMLAQIAARRIE